jgi:hypothetical protein
MDLNPYMRGCEVEFNSGINSLTVCSCSVWLAGSCISSDKGPAKVKPYKVIINFKDNPKTGTLLTVF